MKRIPRRLMLKGGIVACALAVISTCLVSSTFSALSATFTWRTDAVSTGSFDLTDENYKLTLFGNGEIYPGDFGGEELKGEDFKDNTVSWTFGERNSGGIPVLYYAEEPDGKVCGYYSTYKYRKELGAGRYVKLPEGKYISCGDISEDAVSLASVLRVGAKLNWIWAEKLYVKSGESYEEDTSELARGYEERNAELCKTSYVYDEGLLGEAYKYVVRIASGKIAEGYTVIKKPASEYKQGMLTGIARERNGEFGEYGDIRKEDAYVFFINTEDIGAVQSLGEGVKIGGEYAENTSEGKIYADIGKGDQRRRLIRVYPTASGIRASVSVTVEATVYAG